MKPKHVESRLPPELWVNIYKFMGHSFPSIYSLNHEIHNYSWKTPLKNINFLCKTNCADYSKYDFSFVSNLEIKDDRIEDESLQYFQGIAKVKLSPRCKRISDTGLAWLKGIETLDLTCWTLCNDQISDEGVKHLKGIRELKLDRPNVVTHVGLSYLEGIETLEFNLSGKRPDLTSMMEIFRKIPNMTVTWVWWYLQDDDLKSLAGIKSLDLRGNNDLTAEGMKYISGVKNLSIRQCREISDQGLSYLSGIHSLDLTKNYQITDIGLSYLEGIYKLNLSGCEGITDAGLSYLKGVYDLDLSDCDQITLNGLKYLEGVHTLCLSGCQQIDDEFLEVLSGVHCLNLNGCPNFTDDGLRHLKGVRDLDLSFCQQLDGSGLKFLEKCVKLNLSKCSQLANDDLLPLKSAKWLRTLDVRGCSEISGKCVVEMGGTLSSHGYYTFH